MPEYMNAETRRENSRFTPAQIGWLVAFIFYGGLSIASLPGYIRGIHAQGMPLDLVPVGWSAAETRAELVALGWPVEVYINAYAVSTVVVSGLFFALGVLIYGRKTTNRMAWIASFTFMISGAVTFTEQVEQVLPPGWETLSDLLIIIPSGILLLLLLLLFPNGRFVPGWTRWIVIAFNGVLAVSLFYPNSPLSASGYIGTFVTVGTLVCVIGAQMHRYRQVSTPVERQQTRWVVYGISLFLMLGLVQALIASVLPGLTEPGVAGLIVRGLGAQIWGGIFSALIPLSFTIAILRHRLWEIDIIIRRTVQYSILTGLLGLIYFGGVVLFQGLFRTASGETSSLAVVLSTLIIAALFAPLRRRIQNLIDRRFFRQKYDAAQVLADFARTARDETDINQLTGRLVEVVQQTLQPEQVSLWLKPTSIKRWDQEGNKRGQESVR